ncbi:MAG: hypothetical protein ABSC11_11875 [Smithella sp.]|jgi:hypothetical protein
MAEGKILDCVKEIEAYLGMSLETAQEYNFPIARFGRLVRANVDDLDKHISETAKKQLESKQKNTGRKNENANS